MGRRDIQFYDLYKLDKPEKDVEKLTDKSYAIDGILKGQVRDVHDRVVLDLDGDDEPIYGDIEIDDFNKLFRNQNLIRDKFGQSISVKLSVGADGTASREVKEDLSKANLENKPLTDLELEEPNEMSVYSQAGHMMSQYVDAKDFEDEGPALFSNNLGSNNDVKVMTN